MARTRLLSAWLLLATALLLGTRTAVFAMTPAQGLLMLYVGIISGLLLAVARFLLWRLADGQGGAAMLLWSAILGLVSVMFLFSWFGPRLLPEASTSFVEIDLALGLIALALQSVGMFRVRLVPFWVGAIGLASSALGLFARLAWTRLGIAPSLASVGLEAAFLVGAGVSLLLNRQSATAEDIQTASAL